MEYVEKCQDYAHKRLSLVWERFRSMGEIFLKDSSNNFILFAVIILVGAVLLVVFMWYEWRAEHEALAQFLVQKP